MSRCHCSAACWLDGSPIMTGTKSSAFRLACLLFLTTEASAWYLGRTHKVSHTCVWGASQRRGAYFPSPFHEGDTTTSRNHESG